MNQRNKIIQDDITKMPSGLIVHQVNCKGVMGAGVALSIASRWPIVRTMYLQAHKAGELKLGNVIIVPINNKLAVANVCGQENYGKDGKQYTDYAALHDGLSIVAKTGQKYERVYIPYMMGCGLAGGDWSIVSNMIFSKIPEAIIVQYTGEWR